MNYTSRVFQDLHAAHTHLENAILATPTSELRNQLTEANILVLDALEKLNTTKDKD